MFVIKQSETFRWPVVVSLPADGGKTVRHTFDAEFKRLGKEELSGLFARVTEEGGADAAVRAVMVGWSGVTDGSDVVPFSDGALQQLLDIPTVTGAILKAFTEAVSGEAQRKN